MKSRVCAYGTLFVRCAPVEISPNGRPEPLVLLLPGGADLLNKGYEPGLMVALALDLTLRYRAGLRCR